MTTPIHFIPRSHEPQILSTRISHIHAVAHQKHAGTNHWSLYLLTTTPPTTTVSNAPLAINLDCQPSHSIPSTVLHDGSKANVIFSEVPYTVPPDAEVHYALEVVAGLTVQDVWNLMVEHGRQRYEFDADGVGGQFWVKGMLEVLFGQGFLVDAVQVEEAEWGIGRVWPEGEEFELDRGAYY